MANTKILKTKQWDEIIMFFFELREKEELSPSEIVEYFHFKYLTELSINRWTAPSYKFETNSATKLLREYGTKEAIKYIDVLFDNYEKLLNKRFSEIPWSISLLTSERRGYIMTKIFVLLKEQESTDKKAIMDRLLKKPRKDWSREELEQFTKLATGATNA